MIRQEPDARTGADRRHPTHDPGTSRSYELSLSPDAIWIRWCPSCGMADLSLRFSSPEQATEAGVWAQARRCRWCQHLGFDLVPIDPLGRRHLRPI